MQKKLNIKCSQRLRHSTTALAITLAIVAMSITATPSTQAAPNSNKNADGPANVVAHVEIAGGPVTRMLLLKKSGKEYLVLGLDSAAHAVAVDVSEPSQPRTLDTVAGAAGAPASELKVVADTLALFGTSDAESAASAPRRKSALFPASPPL